MNRPQFCDVALPVPLDMAFTYKIADHEPVIGGRVLVPFRTERLSGVVLAMHDRAPSMQAKTVIQVLDTEPVLDEGLIKLGQWIAQYYLAPIGDVFRSMLPLAAEIKKARIYRITEAGYEALHASATVGSSLRSKQDIDTQMLEYSVLDYLAMSEDALEGTIRSATGANRQVLDLLARKKWIMREDATSTRDARRTVQMAVLQDLSGKLPSGKAGGKLNDNQQKIIDFLQQRSGKALVEQIRALDVPRTTLTTLVKRGVVELLKEPAEFTVSSMKKRGPSHLDFIFNAEQKAALVTIQRAVQEQTFSVSLLHGVTGSGKTAVYLAAMQAVLESGRSAILLVPEIGLTPAAAANLHQVFGDEVAILHSALSADERAEQWHRIRRGEARIVVGTRSAVFAPVANLALIVVDEEHDSSYKQEETPRYHGRDVAVMRGKLTNAAVVLASATPSIESYHNAEAGKYRLIQLKERVERRPLPQVELVDMRSEFQQTGEDQIFSRQLILEVTDRLKRGEQAMVLLNRRGYSSVVLCRACGETLQCKNCTIAMTFHKAAHRMECHYCNYRQAVPKHCAKCGSEHIYFLGTGSEKVEERLHAAFPQARIGRLDRDTVRNRHDFEHVLNQFHSGEINLLVGTQMIAKGHDVHGVTLVGVVGADYALGFPDFRAAERTFQLLTQVAGRAGRGEMPGKVVLQTYHPDHYAIQFAQQHDYLGFYEKELRFRKWMHYPPFSALANILLRSDKLEQTLRWTGQLGKWFESTRNEGLRVLGPSVAPILRLKRDYRYHFILKAASREKLNAALKRMLQFADEQKIPRTNLIVDVDALSLL